MLRRAFLIASAFLISVGLKAEITSIIQFPSGGNYEVQFSSDSLFGSSDTFKFVPSSGTLQISKIQFANGSVQTIAFSTSSIISVSSAIFNQNTLQTGSTAYPQFLYVGSSASIPTLALNSLVLNGVSLSSSSFVLVSSAIFNQRTLQTGSTAYPDFLYVGSSASIPTVAANSLVLGNVALSSNSFILNRNTLQSGTTAFPDFILVGSSISFPVATATLIKLNDGTAGSPSLTFKDNNNLGIYRVNSGQMGFATGGAVKFTLTSAGIWASQDVGAVIQTYDGTEALPGYNFSSNSNLGLYRVNSGQMGLVTGGNVKFTLTSTGRFTSQASSATFQTDDGFLSVPGYSFSNDPDNGIMRFGTNDWGMVAAGAKIWETSSAGEINQPLQPSFLATDSASTVDVTGDGTDVLFAWDTEIYDQNSDFNGSTFTAPVSGHYILTASVSLQNILVTHTIRRIQIVTSNRTYAQTVNYALAQTTLEQSYSVVADMDAGDVATVHVSVDGATKTVDKESNATKNVFSGALLN